MPRVKRLIDVHFANYNFEPTEDIYDSLDRQIEVYNTRTSSDFNWLFNKLCKVGDVGFFIVRNIFYDKSKVFTLRGDKIKIYGRFVRQDVSA